MAYGKQGHSRAGRAGMVVIVSIASLALLAGLLFFNPWRASGRGEPLMVHCAAVMAAPMEAIAAAYEKETGVRVQLQFGGSGTLMSGIKVSGQGDLFFAADQSYLEMAREDGLIVEAAELVRLTPVLAVAKGNPKGIAGVDALANEGIRVSMANPDAASIGRVIKEVLVERGMWSAVEANVTRLGVFKPSVNDVANDVKLGATDVAVVWDAVVLQYPELEAVAIAGAEQHVQSAGLGVLTTSKNPDGARRFMQYVAASDRGLEVLKGRGYSVVEGKPWAAE